MLVHSVYFWLKDTLSESEKAHFYEGLLNLKNIPSVMNLYVGKPAKTQPRPVIDNSYTYGLVVVFNDIQAHDEYQVHPIHKDFLSKYSSYWSRVLVYDIQTSS